jgi:hypothetical protein
MNKVNKVQLNNIINTKFKVGEKVHVISGNMRFNSGFIIQIKKSRIGLSFTKYLVLIEFSKGIRSEEHLICEKSLTHAYHQEVRTKDQ